MGLAIIFSGQGNQYPEMFAKFAGELNALDIKSVADFLTVDLLPKVSLNDEDLFSNQYAQPLIASHGFLIWEHLHDLIPAPVAFAGYSLGEVTAIASSAKFSLDELLCLTQKRAELMSIKSSEPSSLMAVSGINMATLYDICQKSSCYVAICNAAQNSIVGGALANLDNCEKLLQELPGQLKIKRLKLAVAAHTPLLAQNSRLFAEYLDKYLEHVFDSKMVSGISAHVQYNLTDALTELARQMSQTVNFNRVIQVVHELGADVILEIGPGHAIANIIKQHNLPIMVKSIDDFKSLADAATWVNKVCGSTLS